ncbi:unnamed protein product [Phytophthora fragariaefolia]|uniref:Unnamed protein product n=1 Tax=Phytophthora fragariaefolia TaxID=1490495 RepID=A0A9W6X557_9STRA|nr:unnamed protein product [Phytophthora fragariaefolia]
MARPGTETLQAVSAGPFVVYTDHASLGTAIKSPHISQRMARWLSLFAEYNFQVEYKPVRLNVVADALSRRSDYAVHKTDANAIGVVRTSTPSSTLLDDVRSAYANDANAKQLLNYFAVSSDKSRLKLSKHLRARVHRYRVHNGLLLYSVVDDNTDRVVVPDDHELKLKITYKYHDASTSGHPGREKTYLLLTRDFYWSRHYKWIRKYVRACEVSRRVKPTPFSQASLQSLPTPSECWQSVSMDFVFGLPPDNKRRTGIVAFVDRFSMVHHLAAVPAEVTAKQTAHLFVGMVFRHHGMPIDILSMSTADHTQTDGLAERVKRILVDALKSYAHSFRQWSDCLPMAEFAINNSVHVSTGTGPTPSYVNAMRHPRLCRHARGPRVVHAKRAQSEDTINTNEQNIQAGPVMNKDAELNTEFSSKAMGFCPAPTSRHMVCARRHCSRSTEAERRQQWQKKTNEFKVGS